MSVTGNRQTLWFGARCKRASKPASEVRKRARCARSFVATMQLDPLVVGFGFGMVRRPS